ncbi:hypothetical protein EJ04DRAFT_251598 [Polyplosphaeria fusca]|uniref:Uncharacterized protein n=1 Tax=Polyplosphaeria fusca TaxID=682080 RepID=A0A9P4V384_9PLEO|nr:hypothetical protein EJ04DRAFT_251598 [Polyplosphaeria fusca]
MDGGRMQEEMAQQLKRTIKEKRRGERAGSQDPTGGQLPTPLLSLMPASPSSRDNETSESTPVGSEQTVQTLSTTSGRPCGTGDTLGGGETLPWEVTEVSGWPDALLFTFYLEHVLPFLFPFYRPPAHEGGRSWILDMMMSSPVVRQTALCQSTYFFSRALGTADCDVAWERVLVQTKEAFALLRESLQAVHERGIAGNLREAVRALASVMQVQRFDIAVSNFENSHAHLNAAIALTQQILQSPGDEVDGPKHRYEAVISRLGPSSWTLPSQCIQVPSAEQADFRFSLSLNILHDIIASAVLQRKPQLQEYYMFLLQGTGDVKPPINLEDIVGCQNWALIQIAEISTLDIWKRQCKATGALDVMELVRRATPIKDTLVMQLARLESNSGEAGIVGDLLPGYYNQQSGNNIGQSSVTTTRIWAHAALLYLIVVVSGWQPANADTRYHVARVIELLSSELSPPALLRVVVFPFFIACSLAEPEQQTLLQGLVESLKPPSIFGTLYKVLDIMGNVWDSRNRSSSTERELFACLRSQGHLVLLV